MKTKRRIAPWILFAVSLGAIVVGLLVGEFRSTMEKAVTVCLSCIGLG
jgi:hypothetical protein